MTYVDDSLSQRNRIGFLLDEESTEKVFILMDYMSAETLHDFMMQTIDTLWDAYKGMQDDS